MIRLPVSIGEAMDKLTILDIKLQKIQETEKKEHCKREYELLHNELKSYIDDNEFYYRILRNINLQIWNMQDEIRAKPNPQKCVDILDKNDMRFRVKNLINDSTRSYLREQKGYPSKRALIIGHLGLGDHIGLIGAVRYIALQYDETVIVCKYRNAENVASFFQDNPSIKLHLVEEATHMGDIKLSLEQFNKVYRSGVFVTPNYKDYDLPKCFYNDMHIDPSVRHTYFWLPTTVEANQLYDKIKDRPYIFVQQTSSTNLTNLISWDINSIFTIDPNRNVYPANHEWYTLAQEFVNKRFLDYKIVLENATEIHTVDSSFYCLACYLPLKANVKKCYSRVSGAFISAYDFT